MSEKKNINDKDMRVLRLLKRRHRPAAVEKALGLSDGDATKLRRIAIKLGWSFPKLPRTSAPVTVREYLAACRDAHVVPQDRVSALLAPRAPETPWPHLVDYDLPPKPRSKAAGEQAARISLAVKHMRHVPPNFAGGGRFHFGRECAEHLAMLIAYAPGKAYPDDPRATRELVERSRFSPPAAVSYVSSPFAQVLEVA
jgi:hypothetical protein